MNRENRSKSALLQFCQYLHMNILLVSAYAPTDTSFGAGQRTHLLHQALARSGAVTTLLLREESGATASRRTTPQGLTEITYAPVQGWRRYTPVTSIESIVRSAVDIDAFDVVVGRYLPTIAALPIFRGRPIVDADDAVYRYPASGVPLVGPLLAALRGRLRQSFTRKFLARMDHVWFVSERDLATFGLHSASVLPNVAISRVATSRCPARDGCILMVGALWYRPNRDAVEWFARRIWPQVRLRFPGAVFRAVGAAPEVWRQRMELLLNVKCPGFVESIEEEYAQASITVVPIVSGGGTQIKVLESLALNVLPVVSPFVAEAFAPHLGVGRGLLVASDESQWVEQVSAMLGSPDQANRLARNGSENLSKWFSIERFNAAVQATLSTHRT